MEFAKLEVPGLPCQATNLRLVTVEKNPEYLKVPTSTSAYLSEDCFRKHKMDLESRRLPKEERKREEDGGREREREGQREREREDK